MMPGRSRVTSNSQRTGTDLTAALQFAGVGAAAGSDTGAPDSRHAPFCRIVLKIVAGNTVSRRSSKIASSQYSAMSDGNVQVLLGLLMIYWWL